MNSGYSVRTTRFQPGDSVRLRTSCVTIQGANALDCPAGDVVKQGAVGKVLSVYPNGDYHVQIPARAGENFYDFEQDMRVCEEDLELSRVPAGAEMLQYGEIIAGIVERVAQRDGAAHILLVTLKGRHETFVVHNTTGAEEEFSMRLTQVGDDVHFTIHECDMTRPRCRTFVNLSVN